MYFELEQDIFDGLRGICEEVRENSEKMTVNAMLMKMICRIFLCIVHIIILLFRLRCLLRWQ